MQYAIVTMGYIFLIPFFLLHLFCQYKFLVISEHAKWSFYYEVVKKTSFVITNQMNINSDGGLRHGKGQHVLISC